MIKLIPDSYIEQPAPNKQQYYCQFNQQFVDELLIKFLKKEGIIMAEPIYEIVSDVDNIVSYKEIYDKQVDRVDIANKRERLEALKQQKLDIEKEIAEIESELQVAEHIISLADDKKSRENVIYDESSEEAVNVVEEI